jgi:transcription initiation factor TFIIIB Brf1 subunit/transcription initiation factor TFIIB
MVSVEPEWRSFEGDAGEDKSRVGTFSDTAAFLSDQGLSSTVSSRNTQLKWLAEAERKRNQTPRDIAILRTFHNLEDIAGKEGLPEGVITTARRVFDQFLTVKPGAEKRHSELYAPAVLFIACKYENARRSMKEVAKIANVSFTALDQMIRTMLKAFATAEVSLSKIATQTGKSSTQHFIDEDPSFSASANSSASGAFGIEEGEGGDEDDTTPKLRPQQTELEDAESAATSAKPMVSRFASMLHVSHLTSILKRTAELVFLKIPSSRLPATMAAAIVFVITQLSGDERDRRPLEQLARASHMGQGAIRAAAQDIAKRMPDVLPTEEERTMFRFKLRPDWLEAKAKLAGEKVART